MGAGGGRPGDGVEVGGEHIQNTRGAPKGGGVCPSRSPAAAPGRARGDGGASLTSQPGPRSCAGQGTVLLPAHSVTVYPKSQQDFFIAKTTRCPQCSNVASLHSRNVWN